MTIFLSFFAANEKESRAGAGLVDAADAPLAAEDAVIDVVFVDTVA
jgi:hypothetical protein